MPPLSGRGKMETDKLYGFAARHGVTVDRYPLKENLSFSVSYNDSRYIAINRELSGNREKVCLAHELGHCVTGSFYNIYAPLDVRGKHERRADCWAIKKLVPEYRFNQAVKHGIDRIYELSEYFGVTPDFMKKAVEYYKTRQMNN